jgi:hypothetical protein
VRAWGKPNETGKKDAMLQFGNLSVAVLPYRRRYTVRLATVATARYKPRHLARGLGRMAVRWGFLPDISVVTEAPASAEA